MDYQEVQKGPEEVLRTEADFSIAAARIRRPNTAYTNGTRAVPSSPTGFQYNASSAGTTGAREPRWPVVAAQTVKDGSVTWTCEAMSSASLERTVQSVTWSAPTGITVGSEAVSGTLASALVSGGTLGQVYDIRADATFSDGTVKSVTFRVEIARQA